jgi:hypothetical protein
MPKTTAPRSHPQKLIYLLLLVPFLCFIFYLTSRPVTLNNPLSNKNQYLLQLDQALQIAQINPLKMVYRDFQDEVEFYIITNDSKNPIKIILSNKKDPYWQVGQIKKIISLYPVHLIDLSLKHPYASL